MKQYDFENTSSTRYWGFEIELDMKIKRGEELTQDEKDYFVQKEAYLKRKAILDEESRKFEEEHRYWCSD